MRLVLAGFACAMLVSCASMSKSECVYADWKAVGYEDGAAGYPATALSSRRQACARTGVTPDMGQYLEGRELGLAQYCTPANGFSSGQTGETYSGVCGHHDEQTFLEEYRAGARLHLLGQNASDARFALRQASEHLASVNYAIMQTAANLIRPDLGVLDRAAQVLELSRLNEDSERTERSLPRLRMAVDTTEAELLAYRSHLASRPLTNAQIAAR